MECSWKGCKEESVIKIKTDLWDQKDYPSCPFHIRFVWDEINVSKKSYNNVQEQTTLLDEYDD